MTAPLIGLLGRKRSGKDTFAERLVEAHGFVRVAFADPLRNTLYDLDPLVRVAIDEAGPLRPEIDGTFESLRYLTLAYLVDRVGWERAKALREVRRLMQAHGVAIREHVAEGVWVEAAMDKIARIRGPWRLGGTYLGGEPGPVDWHEGYPVVVTDVRFPNEADAIQAAGGVLVRIVRPGLVSTDTHVSETALDDRTTDFTFLNSGTVADLHRLADTVLL